MRRTLLLPPAFALLILAFDVSSEVTSSQPAPTYAYVTYDNVTSTFKVHTDRPSNVLYVAGAALLNTVNTTGWAQMTVETFDLGHKDAVQAYAAGLAEGYVSRELTQLHWRNVAEGVCPRPLTLLCQRVQDFLQKNLEWVQEQVRKNSPTDPYWHQVGLFYNQVVGLTHGFRGTPGRVDDVIDPFGLYLLQVQNDVYDLFQKFGNGTASSFVVPGLHTRRQMRGDHCSALVKVCPASSEDSSPELLAGHATWSSYDTMLRVLKRYQFQYGMTDSSRLRPPGRMMVFSSYPGTLTSTDDYYLLSSGLVAMETTIDNHNAALWDQVTPEGQVLETVRSLVANSLAVSGRQWTDIFAKYNSGTYNNQWMIVDYQQFSESGSSLRPGVLTVLEQMPGHVESSDVTHVLSAQGYWSSYNLPYFPSISAVSGTDDMVRRYGDLYSYNMSARARIFRRDHGNVKDIQSAMRLLRYNDFRHDPLSRCPRCSPPYNADYAIASRADLNDPHGSYPHPEIGHSLSGAIDVKVTTARDLLPSMTLTAVSGPTNDQQPDFRWSTADPNNTVSHLGHPDVFNFRPVMFNGSGLFP